MKSLVSYIVLSITLILFSFFYYPRYQQGGSETTISWDVSGYYWYLPAVFIYKDLKHLHFSDSLRSAYGCSPDNQQITILPDGSKVLKYSSGMAVQYLPFFLGAHVISKSLGYPADGLSPPYQIAIHIGALCMMLLGLWYLRKLLLTYFKDGTVAILLLFLMWGTNYTNYVGIDIGMSHAWLFSLYCLLIYASDRFYKSPTTKYAVLIGSLVGLLILSRPTEMIAAIIPLLWGISKINIKEIKARIQCIQQHAAKFLMAIICMLLFGSIQLAYWKYASGHWFVYSYGDQKFSWLHPHFMDYVFSFKCGWLLYCPMMILTYIGFVILYKKKLSFIPILLFSVLNIWIVSAWDVWWYGGRAMLQGSAILMLPFAALIEYVNTKRIWTFIFYPIAFLFLYLNIWWTHGAHHGGFVSASDMTKMYYYKTVGRMKINQADRKFLFINEEYNGSDTGQVLYSNDFTNDTLHTTNDDGNKKLFLAQSQVITKTYSYSPNLSNTPIASLNQRHSWYRFSAHIKCLQNNWDANYMTWMGIQFIANGQVVKESKLQLDQLFYKEREQHIFIDAEAPASFEKIEIYFSNLNEVKGAFLIDDVKLIGLQ
ncbi:MAG: hypothetical protein IPI46_07480 [Bacteroidetes bacterium]|nr:hypothetical protein [Bacteroidota bacterium]